MLSEYDHQGFGESPATGLSITGAAGEVLPRLDQDALCDLVRRLPKDELHEALKTKVMRAVSLPGVVLHAVSGLAALHLARSRGLGVVGYAEPADFGEAVRRVHGAALLREATWGLARRWPRFTASRLITPAQVPRAAAARGGCGDCRPAAARTHVHRPGVGGERRLLPQRRGAAPSLLHAAGEAPAAPHAGHRG